MRRLVPALAIPAFLILLVVSSSFALAREWDLPQVSLEPGESVVVVFANETENSVTLTIQNISAPPELLPFVVITPKVINEQTSENVTITFAYVPLELRQSIVPDNYSIQNNGLVVYLNMSGNLEGIPRENYDSQIASLESMMNDLKLSVEGQFAALEEWVDAFSARIEALENAPPENWAAEIESVRLLMLAELDNIRNTHHENNPSENLDNWKDAIVAEIIEHIDTTLAPQLKRDSQTEIVKVRLEAENNTIYGAIFSVVLVIAAIIIFGKSGEVKKLLKAPVIHPMHQTQVGLDDQIAMLENQINAMKGRGEPIEVKELELKILRDSRELLKKKQGLEKPKEEKPVEKKPEVE